MTSLEQQVKAESGRQVESNTSVYDGVLCASGAEVSVCRLAFGCLFVSEASNIYIRRISASSHTWHASACSLAFLNDRWFICLRQTVPQGDATRRRGTATVHGKGTFGPSKGDLYVSPLLSFHLVFRPSLERTRL